MNTDPLVVPINQILEESRLKVAVARDHMEQLGRFGISSEWLDQVEQEIARAQSTPSYNEQLDRLKSLTVAKNAKLADCGQWGRELRLRLELVYGKKGTPPMPFPAKEWAQSERNESKMITLFPRLIKIATTQAEDLSQAGQTDADIAQGSQLLQDLIKTNQAQEEYNLLRTQETAQRRAIFRRLYDAVNRINQVGQMVYTEDPSTQRLFRSNWFQSSSPEESGSVETVDMSDVEDPGVEE